MRVLFFALALGLAWPHAAIAGAFEDCNQSQDPDRSFRGCSVIIDGRAKDKKYLSYCNRSLVYRDRKDYDRALADIDKAIELNSRFAAAYIYRSEILRMKGDYDSASLNSGRAVELEPANAYSYVARGNVHLEKGENDLAIQDYDRAIQIAPKLALAHDNRGYAYFMKGDYDRAIPSYNRGNVQGGKSKLEEALNADERALAEVDRLREERRKAVAKGAVDLATLASGKDVLKALGYYRRATKLDPDDPEVWKLYGDAARDAGETEEAKAAYEQGEAAATRANAPLWRHRALVGLGNVTKDQGDLPKARNSTTRL